jgi:hypothetical protein
LVSELWKLWLRYLCGPSSVDVGANSSGPSHALGVRSELTRPVCTSVDVETFPPVIAVKVTAPAEVALPPSASVANSPAVRTRRRSVTC